jgi:hypothetical protein
MMDILMSETCWAHKKWNKNNKWHQVGLLFSAQLLIYLPPLLTPKKLSSLRTDCTDKSNDYFAIQQLTGWFL